MFAHLKNKVILTTESMPLDEVRDNAALINCDCDLSPLFDKMKIVKVSTILFKIRIRIVIYFKFDHLGFIYHRKASNNEHTRDDGPFGSIQN